MSPRSVVEIHASDFEDSMSEGETESTPWTSMTATDVSLPKMMYNGTVTEVHPSDFEDSMHSIEATEPDPSTDVTIPESSTYQRGRGVAPEHFLTFERHTKPAQGNSRPRPTDTR